MKQNTNTGYIIYVPIFTALTAFGAVIRIPWFPVPMTLQTFFVLLSGIFLGARSGALSQIIYIIIGLAGIPVFSQGGGPGYVFNPSFGYIIGFPAASFIAGSYIKIRKKSGIILRKDVFFASLFGLSAIYVFGLIYLAVYLIFISKVPVDFFEVINSGLIIFLPGMAVKLILITYVTPPFFKLIRFV